MDMELFKLSITSNDVPQAHLWLHKVVGHDGKFGLGNVEVTISSVKWADLPSMLPLAEMDTPAGVLRSTA